MSNSLYPIRVNLTRDEGRVLEMLAIRECRLPHAQARYLLRLKLIELGLVQDLPIETITPPKGAIS